MPASPHDTSAGTASSAGHRRPEGLTYAVDDRPPFARLLLLGLQMALVVSISLVLMVTVARAGGAAPAVARSCISLSMVALALAAALQAVRKGPVGSGYLSPSVLSANYLPASLTAVAAGGLPLLYGMTIIAGVVEIGFSRLLRHLKALFPPLISGLIVLSVGIEFGLLGVRRLLAVDAHPPAGEIGRYLAAGLVTLGAMVTLSVWGKGLLRLLTSMLGLLMGTGAAFSLGLVDRAALRELRAAPVLGLPGVEHLSYAASAAVAIPYLIAAVASALRVTGILTSCQQLNDPDWKRPEGTSIAGGMLADGLSCAAAGALGTMGVTLSPGAVGISKATGATSRWIAFSMAGWLLLFALIPKVAALFLILPESVVGGVITYTASVTVVSGLQLVAASPRDIRRTLIIGPSLLLGLSRAAFPAFYAGLPGAWQPFTGSVMSITTLTAIALNLLFRLGISRSAASSIETDQESLARLETVIRKGGSSWGVAADVVDTANAAAQRLLLEIEAAHLARGPVQAHVRFDEVSFRVELHYEGEPLPIPTRHWHHNPALVDEAPAEQGLASFLMGAHPNRVHSRVTGRRCEIEVGFDL